MTQLWLITLPGTDANGNDKSEKVIDTLRLGLNNQATGPLARALPFEIPQLSIGSLDSLMTLSDDLVKVNTQVESVLRKIERQYSEVTPADADKLRIGDVQVGPYLKQFQWDAARYKVSNTPLGELVAQVQSTVSSVDDEMKKLSLSFSEKNQAYSAILRRKTVNLTTSDFEDFLTTDKASGVGTNDSEFIVTVAAVIPAAIEAEFLKTYFTIGSDIAVYGGPDWERGGCGRADQNFGKGSNRASVKGSPVIPETPKKLHQEGDSILYTMSVLKGHYEAGYIEDDEFVQGKYVDYIEPLVTAARERRVVIRPWKYEPAKSGRGGIESLITEAGAQVQMLKVNIAAWCRSHFGEVYVGWIHLKVIKAFVESVLRYGVPATSAPKYSAMFIQPNMKNEKAASQALTSIVLSEFPELAAMADNSNAEEKEDVDDLPYVCHKFTVVGVKPAAH